MGQVEHLEPNQKQSVPLPPEYRTTNPMHKTPMINAYYNTAGPIPNGSYFYSNAAPPTYQTNASRGNTAHFAPAQAYQQQQPQPVYVYTNNPYQNSYYPNVAPAAPYTVHNVNENRYKTLVQNNPKEIGIIAALSACLACCLCGAF